jgi:ribosomal protein RSM22 (predicted rRNA methylase)
MRLPTELQSAIEREAARYSFSHLAQVAAELSESYRSRAATLTFSAAHRVAYAVVRLPATFAAVRAALAEIRRLAPELRVKSLLDYGAGPGTAAWAATEIFPELQRMTLLERDQELIRLGKIFAQSSAHAALRTAQWQATDFRTADGFAPHDLVICSYSLGENDDAAARLALKAAWQAAAKIILIIEPGTTQGFSLIRALRDELTSAGAHLVAPCPHERACPMSGDDWCHFAQRCERSSLHRRIKGAELGYEDEKFSYLAAAREPVTLVSARVVRHPLRRSGFIRLELCAQAGLTNITITHKDKAAWRRARKTDWGDAWH